MEINDYIRACNALTEPYFTNGGSFKGVPSGPDSYHAAVVLMAWHTRNALETRRELDKRVCDVALAREQQGRAHAHYVRDGRDASWDASYLSDGTLANALALATSLVCDDVRALSERRPAKRGANRDGLTWSEWYAAAGRGPTATREAWLACEDPTEHRGA